MSEDKGGCHDFCWMIGGPQGTGVDSSATLFARAAATAGHWVYGRREYHSNIKGKHSYFQIRVKNEPVLSHVDPVNLLASFETTTPKYHDFELLEDGGLIYDPKLTDPEELTLGKDVLLFPIDFDGILEEVAEAFDKTAAQISILKNAIAVAASCALVGIGMDDIEEALKGLFTGKKAKLVPLNVMACQKGYDTIMANPNKEKYRYFLPPPVRPKVGSRLLINGNQTTALAKFKAGCRLQTYYSITPAVDECVFMEGFPEYGVAVVQCEDEMAAINMAIGGATTGIRASTSTSGPGFCLMAEGMGWAAINEVPVVVFNYQRGGPSTGLPTRQEQGDMLFTIHSGHGEYPRIVLAPGDVNEQFEDSYNAFNDAEHYQTPVIVLSDRTLANNTMCVPIFPQDHLTIDRGDLLGPPDGYIDGDESEENLEKALEIYPRFTIRPDSPMSYRPVAGTPGRVHWLTGDESDEWGHITEDPVVRNPQHEKRMSKLPLITKEIPADRQYKLYGPDTADITVVGWGSTKGAVLDAMERLREDHDVSVNFLQIRMVHPFPTEAVTKILKAAKTLVNVEANLSGQMAQLIQMRTCIEIPHRISKYTGRPISETEMVDAILEIQNKQSKEVVLTYGI